MKKQKLMQDWLFWKEGNESEAQRINLPHDAMILEERIPDMENGSATGYYPGGKYYYEKRFWGKEEYQARTVMLEFEGVYMNSSVFLNGEKVGGWMYGYTNFFADLTGKIRIGEENILRVEADNSKTPNSRWYSGSGIYRPVNLWTGELTYVKPQGLMIKTISIHPAMVHVDCDYEVADGIAEDDVSVFYTIYDGEKQIASVEGKSVDIVIPDAKLWSAETPSLYQIQAVLKVNGVVTDETWEKFGIRTLSWSAEHGFMVNNETVKLRGGCIHHDHGILGGCTYDKAEYRRVRKLKEFGFNAIRYSHYPAGKNFLDVCDELGMYVLDETFDQWRIANTTYDYSTCFDEECEKDTEALARKDYNHPSVIMYCIGNEIPDVGRSYGASIAHRLCEILNRYDGTRPITLANNAPMMIAAGEMEKLESERGAKMGSIEINELITAHPELLTIIHGGNDGAKKLEELAGRVFDELDISGHNYATAYYDGIHEIRPDSVILSTETLPAKIARNWNYCMEHDYCIGDFHWTAWDYLGEAGVGLSVYGTKEAPFAKPYPCLTAACGSFDLVGSPEAAAYYAAIIWGVYKKPYIGVRPVNHSGEDYTLGIWRLTDAIDCWSWEGYEGRKAEIVIYSIGEQVELYQDGVSLGRKHLEDWKAEYETTYCAGKLEAVSFASDGTEIERTVLKTAGSDVRLAICPEEMDVAADTDELVFVPIYVTDENGIIKKTTDRKISVTVEGEGQLIALGSGRPDTEESFSNNAYMSWHGQVLAVIRCTGQPGNIKITARIEQCEGDWQKEICAY